MSEQTPPSLSERYQEATKYTPQSVQGQAPLDFDAQPAPFKDWHQARRYPLAGGPGATGAPPESPPSRGVLDAERLGRLLFHTYGVTLVREYPNMTMHYRAAPSAGGLYPSELYIALRNLPGLPDALYAYDAPSHALVACWEGNFWPDLEAHSFGHPAIAASNAVLIATGLWERSAWRYGDRGYRRVLLDTGHMVGNALLAARVEGLAAVPLPYFDDQGIAGLLLLEERREGPLLLAALVEETPAVVELRGPAYCSAVRHDLGAPASGAWTRHIQWAGALSGDSVTPVDAMDAPQESGPPAAGPSVQLDATPLPEGAAVYEAIRHRRSTRMFQPNGRISAEIMGRILAHAYPLAEGDRADPRLLPEALCTWLIVSRVEGLPSGVYRYEPGTHTATPTRIGDPREALFQSCLWQELGRDCAFAVVHTVDLPAAVESHGERVYRTSHLDAGMIGQRLNLAALRLGQGASGIGGFFDEFLNDLLLLGPQHAIVYVTTIGVPEPRAQV